MLQRQKESLFREFCASGRSEKSGIVHCYPSALNTIDELFAVYNPLGISCSVWDIEDEKALKEIFDFLKSQERSPSEQMKSAFPGDRTSYLKHRFCSSAVHKLIDFNEENSTLEKAVRNADSSEDLGSRLEDMLKLKEKKGRDVAVETTQRDGQYLFRHALLKLYGGQCAVTGIRVVPVLRASHISEWAKDTENRLNPANGICLSATFDAAFDRHLISFDYDYRMLLTPALKEYFTNDETRETFEKYEGKRLLLPTDERFLPGQNLLMSHRQKCGL